MGTDLDLARREIERLGPWFHNVKLPNGLTTAPDHFLGDFPSFKWQELAPHLPEDLEGWTVLDIGCNAGFYSFELAKRGATVTGIDADEHYLAQARWLACALGLEDRVRFQRMQVYDLAHTEEKYDLVLFMGVLYHLRYPMLGLDIVAQKVKRLLVMQTLSTPGREVYPAPWDIEFHEREPLKEPGWPALAFLEHRMAGDPTNWFVPNHAACEAMLRSAGMRILGHPMEEAYLCEPDPERPSAMATWNRDEYLSAVGGRTRPPTA
ncbi:TIGR04290 family methyltransferase [bacterium]|nr:MAG: TIGR04290 family methyltransferase [bacterium]